MVPSDNVKLVSTEKTLSSIATQIMDLTIANCTPEKCQAILWREHSHNKI